jgi:hypothetical protein
MGTPPFEKIANRCLGPCFSQVIFLFPESGP